MAGVVTTKLLEALADLGIDVSKKQPSNVKTLATKNKSTATKPGLLAGERDTGGNFGTVLDIFKKEAQYIDGMNDVEQMAFLNNIMDYNEFGGKSINKASEGITGIEKNLEDLQSTAKTMKDDAEKGLKSAEDDLKVFLETGGNPLKKEDKKFLGGSMHEEGQLRTAIRTFLKNEYKNGRIKLDKDDQFRVMEYSPMLEDDPIKVFKKIYGDEAYNKAGSFPGAFEKGEDFNHYEKIFKENMGEDLLKVKDNKYVGDGTLVLTKQEEVFTPTPDEDTPFAKGGRASFAGGKLADELIAMIITKEPMDAMKELNKIIGKKGKYKNLTQKDIDRIVNQTNDHIFQRDPDNLYVEDRPMFKQGDDKKRLLTDDEIRDYEAELGDSETWMMDGTVEEAEKALKDRNEYIADMKKEYDAASPAERAEVIGTKKVNVDDMSVEDSLTTLEGLGATKMAERFKLKQRYPGISEDLLTNIIEDTDSVHKASVLAKMDQAMKLIVGEGKGTDEAIDILKSEPKTKMATGGRAGYYGGGITNMIEPDLSDIGHGSDSLMARTRITAPGSQATTSTGLNYLLGEDNDNIRIPFNEGLLVPPKKPYVEKPYTTEMFEDESMTLLKGMYGTGPDSNEFLYNEMIKKGNKLREKGVERETVIEIIRKNKDKIDMILKQQTGDKKSLAGLADGGIADLRPGYSGGLLVDKGRRGFLKFLGGTAAGVAALKAGLVKMFGKESGAISKKAIDEVIIDGGSGAPAWLQPLVNKALREGKDISQNAIVDGQVVKSLDTPTGKVDVYYNTRTGEVDIDYIGGNTALGESVNMRYVPGVADEGTKGVKPADEFEAIESIPEYQGGNPLDGPSLEVGENITSDVKGLYSDTSELAELGGQKPLIKDISDTIKKKKVLKKMEDQPADFITDEVGIYDPT